MNIAVGKVCPSCDAHVLKEICLNCGQILSELQQNNSVHKSISSLFEEISGNSKNICENLDTITITTNKKPYFKIGTLLINLFLFGFLSYQFYNLTLKNNVIKNNFEIKYAKDGEVLEPAPIAAKNILGFEFKSNLPTGNFTNHNYSIFSPENIFLYLETFNLTLTSKKFVPKESLDYIKTNFRITEKDFKDKTTDQFILLYPTKELEKWGFAIEIKDKPYFEKILTQFENDKAKQAKSKTKSVISLNDYFAKIIEIKEEKETKTYLLISNNKEFLDQMKENSEGVVPNLFNSAKYKGVRNNLPTTGAVLIYNGSENFDLKALLKYFLNDIDTDIFDNFYQKAKTLEFFIINSNDTKTEIQTID